MEGHTLEVKQSHSLSEGCVHDATFVECVISKLKYIETIHHKQTLVYKVSYLLEIRETEQLASRPYYLTLNLSEKREFLCS